MSRRDDDVGETDASLARLAFLTGICPKCGDGGWWIDDDGEHYCDCPAGVDAMIAASTK